MLTIEQNVGGPALEDELLLSGQQRSLAITYDDETGVIMNYSAQPAFNRPRNTGSNGPESFALYSPGVTSAFVKGKGKGRL